jgi:hypothetical protein
MVMWDLWWTKWRWGGFSPRTSVSLANLHSTKFSIIIITRGSYNRRISGRHAEWTQLDSTPTKRIKKKHGLWSLDHSNHGIESLSDHECLSAIL